MKKICQHFFIIISIVSVFALKASTSYALIAIEGYGNLGAFSGTLDYSYTDEATAELEIILENISSVENGGYITAFAFNNPYGLISGAVLASSSDPDFDIIGDPDFDNDVNASPYGQFDIGVSTGNSFQGGGAPQKGIAVDTVETFLFTFNGAGLDTLTDMSFLNTLSVGPGDGEGNQAFVVRFRGFNDGGSDKVPGNVVPEPASLVLFGTGLLGFGLVKRKK